MNKPLDGIKVLDLSRLLPGPYATMILASLGATVIKVEEPGAGDPARHTPPVRADSGLAFDLLNRDKKSLAVNLKSSAGAEIFRRLAKETDVVLEGFRPGVMERLGIGYQTLRSIQPRLIYCSITGYGQSGPLRLRSGHDVNYLARAGVLGLQTAAGGKPVLSGIQVADIGGALNAVIGILAALRAREFSGLGQYVDVSMADAGMAFLPMAAAWTFAGRNVPVGTKLPLSGELACYNVYETADGRFLSVGALEAKFWQRFCAVLGREDLVPLQMEGRERQQGMIEEVGKILRGRTLREWLELFREADACVEPVLTMEEAFSDPQALARKVFVESRDPAVGTDPGLGLPFKLSDLDAAHSAGAPKLGEHNREILRAAGYSITEIESLESTGILRQAE